MSQDSSLVGAFDLNSQTGVMSILASIRGSKLSAPGKNELRDLVFLYTNGGGDASVRIALEQKLATYQIVPVQVQQTLSAGPILPFGSYRPTPTFRKTPQVVTVPVQQVPPPVVKPVVPVEPVTPVAPIIPPSIVAEPVPVAPIPVVTPATPAPVPISAPEVVVSTPAPAAVLGEANYLERIRQIKTAVNSKVGNPVNLVDINNEVGREYMNALLEAMKKLSSGAVSEMDPAMNRLEAAYTAVEVAIAGHRMPTPVAVAPIAPADPVVPIMSAPTMPEMTIPVSVATSVPVPLPPDVETVVPVTPSPIEDLPPRPVASVEIPEPLPLRAEGIPPPPSFALSDRQKILTPQDLPEASSISTAESGDPLFTKEVDDGLNQLLSDWTLFKKSGLFGTGPKGREHPLFKKIADLQVPLLLAGRFEGSTQEIRQSVTDYMNGWRYEQGIVYQPGETFEKYLRRVIKHIISLQKKHKQP